MASIALQMYTMRNFMGRKEQVKDTLEKVAKIGYTKVQMSVPAFMTVEEVKEMLDACGLQADSALAHSMKIDEEFDQIMHEAQVLGTHVIRLDGIPKELAQTPEGFREYAAILEKAGFKLEGRLRCGVVKSGRALNTRLYALVREAPLAPSACIEP